jgi:hypothetical protein
MARRTRHWRQTLVVTCRTASTKALIRRCKELIRRAWSNPRNLAGLRKSSRSYAPRPKILARGFQESPGLGISVKTSSNRRGSCAQLAIAISSQRPIEAFLTILLSPRQQVATTHGWRRLCPSKRRRISLSRFVGSGPPPPWEIIR